jgi:hypothetical protein
MIITIDTHPLRAALNAPFGILAQIIDLLPSNQLTQQLSSLLNLAPKFVITIGDVSASANASPAFSGSPVPGPPEGGGTGGGPFKGGGNVPPGIIGNGSTPSVPQPSSGPTTSTVQPPSAPSSLSLPGLGSIPRLVILAALVLTAVGAWLFRTLGGFMLGAGRHCAYGLSTGVPDLRKG